MQCIVYRSDRRPGTYIYVADPESIKRLPPELTRVLGALVEALRFELTPGRKLAMEDPARVLANLQSMGYHVQFPPPEYVPLPDPTA